MNVSGYRRSFGEACGGVWSLLRSGMAVVVRLCAMLSVRGDDEYQENAGDYGAWQGAGASAHVHHRRSTQMCVNADGAHRGYADAHAPSTHANVHGHASL